MCATKCIEDVCYEQCCYSVLKGGKRSTRKRLCLRMASAFYDDVVHQSGRVLPRYLSASNCENVGAFTGESLGRTTECASVTRLARSLAL